MVLPFPQNPIVPLALTDDSVHTLVRFSIIRTVGENSCDAGEARSPFGPRRKCNCKDYGLVVNSY